jgi:hypothetical protein
MHSGHIALAGVIATVVVVIAVGGLLMSSASPPLTTSLLTTSSGSTTSSITEQSSTLASNGLKLIVSITPTSIAQGGSVNVVADVLNTLSTPDNVSASVTWPLASLQGPCNSGTVSIALYQGSVSSENVGSASVVPLYGPGAVPCPDIPNYNFFVFSPNSDTITGYAGSLSSPHTFRDYTSFTLQKYYDPSSPSAPNLVNLQLGTYTLIVGDIWGNLVFLPFSVS